VTAFENVPPNNPKFFSGYELVLRGIREYRTKHLEQETYWTAHADLFPKTVAWVKSLPFSSLGRVMFFFSEPGQNGVVHSDGWGTPPHRSCFIWLRHPKKRFFLLNPETGEKVFIESRSAFFNSHDFHGSDASEEFTFSMRIDGNFTPEFEALLGIADLATW